MAAQISDLLVSWIWSAIANDGPYMQVCSPEGTALNSHIQVGGTDILMQHNVDVTS